MKCCDDGLVNRGAVRLMKRPQRELVSHLLSSCIQTLPLTWFSLIKCLPQWTGGILGGQNGGGGVMSQSVWGPEPPGSTGNTGDSFSSNNSTDDSRGGWGEVGQELRQTERGTFPSVCYVTVDRKLGSSLSVGEETHRNMADLIVQKRRLLELCERRPLAPLVALSWHRAITLLW